MPKIGQVGRFYCRVEARLLQRYVNAVNSGKPEAVEAITRALNEHRANCPVCIKNAMSQR